MDDIEFIASMFHKTYEAKAHEHNYTTRKSSAVDWKDVPENNRNLMMDTVRHLLETGVIVKGS